jgi:uncharacterized protein
VVIGVTEGPPGLRALVARLTRWRVGWSWWAVALGLPPAMVLVAAVLNGAAGAAAPAWPAWGGMALLFGLYLVNPLGGALGEEPGWRGYAQPCLQARRSALVSALVLGVLVAGWHLPLVATGQLGIVGIVTTVAITVVYAWLFNRTGGSALITLVAHALQDSFTFGALGYAAWDAARVEYLYSLVVIAVAVAVAVLDRTAWKAAPEAAVQPGRPWASKAWNGRWPVDELIISLSAKGLTTGEVHGAGPGVSSRVTGGVINETRRSSQATIMSWCDGWAL